jgi:hypothetical protein
VRIAARYSHLNGLEYLLVHKPELWKEITSIVEGIDAEKCKTKISKEKRTKGKILYSPIAMNAEMQKGFSGKNWAERRQTVWVTHDEKIVRHIITHRSERSEEKHFRGGA